MLWSNAITDEREHVRQSLASVTLYPNQCCTTGSSFTLMLEVYLECTHSRNSNKQHVILGTRCVDTCCNCMFYISMCILV